MSDPNTFVAELFERYANGAIEPIEKDLESYLDDGSGYHMAYVKQELAAMGARFHQRQVPLEVALQACLEMARNIAIEMARPY